jgi:SAM-dependent methyltransferase
MKWLKEFLKCSPLLVKLVRLYRFLVDEAWFAAWVRFAPKKFMDKSHIRRSWDFSSSDSQEWHSWVLTLIAAGIGTDQWGDVLEIGCSEGIFTSYLATRCRSVEALDISPIARDRAAERCAQFPNVRIGLLDLANDEVKGQYDLVFAMDILSSIRGRQRLTKAVSKLVRALREDGVLIYTDNSMPLDVLRSWGSHPWWGSLFAIMEPDDCLRFLESRFPLQLISREQYLQDPQGGRDQLFALLRKGSAGGRKSSSEVLEGPIAGVASPVRHS